MPRNYPGYSQALPLPLPAADPASLADAARRLIETSQPRSIAIPDVYKRQGYEVLTVSSGSPPPPAFATAGFGQTQALAPAS